MEDVPQPFTTHPGAYLEDHDLDRFGCTVCHLGQGQATTRLEAHALSEEVYWDWPVLTGPWAQATCGTCHDPTYLTDRGAPLLGLGLTAFQANGCLGCHKLGGRGGTLGPALDQVGDKTSHSLPFDHVEGDHQVWTWHQQHLLSPRTVVPDSTMPAVEGEPNTLDALTIYLLSLRTTNLTESLTPFDRYQRRYRIWHTEPLSGAELYEQFCQACHEDGTETVFHDSLDVTIPGIMHPDFLATATVEFLVENLRLGRAGTPMTAWAEDSGGLTDDELERIAAYLLESRTEVREVTFEPEADPDVENGRLLFESECTDCHVLSAAGGEAPWLGSPGFQATYSDSLMGHTIKFGRRDSLMIGYGEEADGDFTDRQVSDLVAYIRTLR